MDYQVAIPSYRRPTELARKSYQMLVKGGVPVDRITVFVASAHEADLYRAALPDGTRIVVGVLGLAAQRAFIHKYYTEGQLILFVDDDLTHLKKLSGDRLITLTDIHSFVEEAFAKMHEVGSKIFSIYPAASSMYMKEQPEFSTELRYLMGGFYGIVNRDPPELLYGDNQEDKERTLRYWKRDKKLLRFNHITMITRFYTPGGMDSPTRKADTEAATMQMVKEFPGLVKQIHKAKAGYHDLRFINPAKAEDAIDSAVEVLPLRAGYEAARDKLLAALAKTHIPKLGNPSKPEHRKRHGVRADNIGSIGRTATYGFGNTRAKGIAEFKWNKKNPEVLRAMIEFGNKVVPPGWKYTAITLNKDVLARKHRDPNNVGRSVIIGIGNYKGGALRVWDEDDTVSEDYDLKDRPTMFNGALRPHETQPFEGERYTLIFYKQKWDGKCEGMPDMVGEDSSVIVAVGGAGTSEELALPLGGDRIAHA